MMRLTLRTLLAYRDGVLDPKDASVLEAKIKDSSTAQQISQRIVTEMRNRRLAPIPVDAREFGFEANMVAEFLDDTIPMETLPEMERKCLENNSLLSEIGSCHQILTRALTIPAPVSSELRQRIHNLPHSASTNHAVATNGRIRRLDAPSAAAGVASESISAAAVRPSTKSVRKPNVELRGSGIELNDGLGRQVPEYLIGSDRGWLKTAAIAISLLIALVVVGAMAIGPVDRVRDLLRKSTMVTDVNKSEGVTNLEPKEPRTSPTIPANTIPLDDGANSDDTDAKIVESASAPPSPSLGVSKIPEAIALDPSIKTPLSPSKNRIQWLPDTKASSESILLKFSISEKDSVASWRRMNPGEFVNDGERIVVPPTQRTELRVEPGIRILVAGENDLELAKGNLIPKIQLHSGNILVFATPDARDMKIDCNGLELAIHFMAADGSCALEMQNLWSPFTDAMVQAGNIESQSAVRLIGVEGSLQFSTKQVGFADGKGTLAVGQYIDCKNGVVTTMQELAEAPWWFRTSISRPIDQLAASDLQRALIGKSTGEIEAELIELTNHRRGETAALAARTRMLLGRYDGLFETEGVFNRKTLHSHWQSLITQIPQSLGREDHRTALVSAIRSASPSRVNSILSLLLPPSQEQLSAGADKMLVEFLSSPLMDERVLSINQLTNITGKNLGFHPDKNQVESIQQWRKLLGKNEIRYSEPIKTKTE